MTTVGGTALLDAFQEVVHRLAAEPLEGSNLVAVLRQMIEVGIFVDETAVDKSRNRLFRDTLDVDALLAHESRELLQLLGRTVGVGAVQRLRAALTLRHHRLCTTYRAHLRHLEHTHLLSDANHLRYNLVGLDHLQTRTLAPDAQSLTLTDVTERGTLHGRTLQLHRREDSHGRNRISGTRPFNVVQSSVGMRVLPFKGIARTCSMMACHRPRSSIHRIIVGYHQTVDREGEHLVCHLVGEEVHHRLDILSSRVVDAFALHGIEAQRNQEVHPLTPRGDVVLCIY